MSAASISPAAFDPITSTPAPLHVLVLTRDPNCLRSVRDWPESRVSGRTASSIDEAVLLLEREPQDAVVVDAAGPDGLSALDSLRDAAPSAALISLITRDDPELRFEAVRRGAQECLTKRDLDGGRLLQAVRYAVDRKWISAFVEQREELLDGVFRALSPAIVVLDSLGIVALANRGWERFAQSSSDGLSEVTIGSDFLGVLGGMTEENPSLKEHLVGIGWVLNDTLPSFRTEYRRRSIDGDAWYVLQVDPLGGQGGAVLTYTDITDRKRVEETLRRSEQDFRQLLDTYPEAVAVHRDGRFIYVNQTMVLSLGYSRADELVGRPAMEMVHPDDRALVAARLGAARAGQRTLPVVEERILRADGSVIHCEVAGMSVVFDGRPANLVIARDLTERRALTAQMMQLDRMLSVGLLAAGLGHEINNPLAFVSANVDVALRNVVELEHQVSELGKVRVDPDVFELVDGLQRSLKDVREALGDAREGSRRIGGIVQDLRAFARPENDRDGPVDVEHVINAAVNMAWNEIRHRAKLVRDFTPVPNVNANEAQLGQVFLNLLTNAAQAIEPGHHESNEIRIRIYPVDDSVIVEIADTGCGISPDVLPRIFEPFFTTKAEGQGTGFGLAICRNIVMRLGGSVNVSTELGRGSTFRVSLRAARGHAVRRKSSLGPLAAPARSLSVLVVDDEVLIGRVVARCLGREHRVTALSNGREALERLKTSEHFDVVFLDVMMPDMTGIEVYEALQREAPERLERVVFLTGGAFTARAREFLATVPNRQVPKPFESRLLRSVAEETAAKGSD